jgi:hypothetical protein
MITPKNGFGGKNQQNFSSMITKNESTYKHETQTLFIKIF